MEDDAGLDVDVLAKVYEIVVLAAMILDQAKIGLLPAVPVGALCETDSLMPPLVGPLPEVPHPEFIADSKHRAVVGDPDAVVGSLLTKRDDDLSRAFTSSLAVEV